jgi:uncharacterized protein YegP (UPF0339 family)
MRPSLLRDRLGTGLLDFAWDEWAQMGVLASPQRHSPWAQDPEALLVFSLEVARDDPRLFDEILDWLATNEGLLSVRRLRAVCAGPEDERLVEATLGWLSQLHPRPRLAPRPAPAVEEAPLEPLFRGLSTHVPTPDPAFMAVGLLRPEARASGAARPPDLRAPINLAFRLRQLLGVGARAEIVRYLLTVENQTASAHAVTRAAGFAARNVREALLALHAAGVVALGGSGCEQRYSVDRERWMRLLEIDPGELPTQRDWPQLLRGVVRVLRWLTGEGRDDLSDYLLGSKALTLLDESREDFEQAGIHVAGGAAEDAWQRLEALVDQSLRALAVAHDVREEVRPGGPDHPAARPRTGQVYEDPSGEYRWRLIAADGEFVAVVAEAFASRPNAERALRTFATSADSWRYEIYHDVAGGFKWRAKASNGETVAVSPGSFQSMENAERAMENVRAAPDDLLLV